MSDDLAPGPQDRFSFGLWTVGHRGGDPFGAPTRPRLEPEAIVTRLAELGVWGVSLHDEDLVPFGVPAGERDRIVASFKTAVAKAGMRTSMMTVNLFFQPVFADGAFTAADPQVRRFALRKAMEAVDIGAELGAPIFVLWGGREGVDTGAARDPAVALERYREGINFLCEYIRAQGLHMKLALEAKPNEPRGHIYLPTTGHMLHFISTLQWPEMVGVNPEMAHEAMAGLAFHHGVGQALWSGKLLHIDLNGQYGPRYDQDLRFGSEDLKEAFLTIRLLERAGFDGPRNFDCRAYRTEDDIAVFDHFARGCIRNYKILAAKAAAFDADPEVQAALEAAGARDLETPTPAFSDAAVQEIRNGDYALAIARAHGRGHERIDQLMLETILGAR